MLAGQCFSSTYTRHAVTLGHALAERQVQLRKSPKLSVVFGGFALTHWYVHYLQRIKFYTVCLLVVKFVSPGISTSNTLRQV